MNHNSWDKGVTRNHLRLEADLFAQKMGMKYDYTSSAEADVFCNTLGHDAPLWI